jgi:hypothetical protein
MLTVVCDLHSQDCLSAASFALLEQQACAYIAFAIYAMFTCTGNQRTVASNICNCILLLYTQPTVAGSSGASFNGTGKDVGNLHRLSHQQQQQQQQPQQQQQQGVVPTESTGIIAAGLRGKAKEVVQVLKLHCYDCRI